MNTIKLRSIEAGCVFDEHSFKDMTIYEDMESGDLLYRGLRITELESPKSSKDGMGKYRVVNRFVTHESSFYKIIERIDYELKSVIFVENIPYKYLGKNMYESYEDGTILRNVKFVNGKFQTTVSISGNSLWYYSLGSYYPTDFPMKLSMRGKSGKITTLTDYSQVAIL